MQSVNADGLYATVQSALPHLTASSLGGRVVVVSPPIYSRFFRGKTAYAMGKVAMSVLTKGLAMDFERQGLVSDGSSLPGKGSGRRQRGMAITSLWPAVAIESAATAKFTTTDPSELRDLRKATIFSDAVLAILSAPARGVNGQLELDEDVLRRLQGFEDQHFDKYAVVPGCKPRRIMPAILPDLRVAEQDDEGKKYNSALAGKERQKL
jgi:NAD(P)-dependent dehydrogenase (short-subunit alcohol dehydrogenase family)